MRAHVIQWVLCLVVGLCACGGVPGGESGTGISGGDALGGGTGGSAGGDSTSGDIQEAGTATGPVATPIPIEAFGAASNTSLPLNVAPVVDITNASLNAPSKGMVSAKAATSTGIGLADLSDQTFFSAEASRASCMAAVNLHDTVRTAAANDIVLCLLQEIYDGRQDELFSGTTADKYLTIVPDSGVNGFDTLSAASIFHIQATRDSENRLTEFTAHGCKESGTVQTTYLTQTLDPSVSSTSTDNFSAKSLVLQGTDLRRVTATGHVSYKKLATGAYTPVFTQKTINTSLVSDGRIINGPDAFVDMSESTFSQTSATKFTMDAYSRDRQLQAGSPTMDFRSYIKDGVLIDENNPGDSLFQGVAYEPTYSVSKLGLGSSISNVINDSYTVDWLAATPSESTRARAGFVSAWAEASPFSVLHTYDPAQFTHTPREVPNTLVLDPDTLFSGSEVWSDCKTPTDEPITQEALSYKQYSRCALLALEKTHVACHQGGGIYNHLTTAQVTGGPSGSDVYLRTDQTATWSVSVATQPTFVLTFDGRATDASNLIGEEKVALTKDGTSVDLAYGNPSIVVHVVRIQPTTTLSAGSYTLTVGPGIHDSTQKSVFNFTVE
jgi:hypothetical protein